MRMKSWNVDNVNIMSSLPPAASKPARTYHHGDLRNALIDAGLAALEVHDASELSLRALARDLGVSANAVYRHFADKNALLAALAAEGFRRFAQAQHLAHQAGQGDAAVTGLAYVQFAQRHPALFRLMFGRFTRTCVEPTLQESAMAAFEQLLTHSRSPTAPGGRDAPVDEATLMRALARWSLVHGLSHLLLEGQLSLFGPPSSSSATTVDASALIQAVLQASGLADTPPAQAPSITPDPARR